MSAFTVNDLMNARGGGGYLILGSNLERLKERGVYSHYCSKLNKNNMLSVKISREY